ncbi:MAG: hypothetical protein EXS09_04460 [Gemmataceae bacterium]|nr:hypothetical protein [Gemmataceae bacterium]
MSRILAIDIDQGSAYVATGVARGGSVKLEQVVTIPLGETLTPSNAAALGKQLKDALKSHGIPPGPVVAVVGRDRVILKDIKIPKVAPGEEPALVRFQASKDMTEAFDSVVLDYFTLDRPDADGQMRAVTATVRKDLLASYKSFCQAAGLKLEGLTARPLGTLAALDRAFVTGAVTAPEAKHSSIAVLSRGEKWGELVVARDGQVIFSRTISATSLTAEAMLLGELRRNLAVYNGQNPQQPVESLFIAEAAGPSGTWSGRIRAGLTIPVQAFDPLAGVEHDTSADARGQFAGLAGVLQLKSKAKPLPIDFASPRQAVSTEAANKRIALSIASILALFIIGGLAFGYIQVEKKQARLTELVKEKSALDKEVKELEEDAKRIKIYKEWDTQRVNWLDEIYDLAARFPDINGARLEQFRGEPYAMPKAAKNVKVDKNLPVLVAKMFLKIQTESGKLMDEFQTALQADKKYHHLARQTKGGATAGSSRFTHSYELIALVERRPASEYTRTLSASVPAKPSRAMKGFGERTGGGFPEFGKRPESKAEEKTEELPGGPNR